MKKLVEIRTFKSRYSRDEQPIVEPCDTEALSLQGRVIVSMVERWGMVAAVDNGEDSAGRAQLRLATPEAVVSRAIATTNLMFAHFRDEGLLVELPSEEELKAEFEPEVSS